MDDSGINNNLANGVIPVDLACPDNVPAPMIKRQWCYCQPPKSYEVYCDKCGASNTTWSEYEGHIWCFDCEIDTEGTKGIFGGPIPLGSCGLMGISFDRIRLADNVLMQMRVVDGEITYDETT